jgi:membrane-associated phospholipid phosphatase
MQRSLQNQSEIPKLIVCLAILIFLWAPYAIVDNLPLHRYTIPFILGEQYIPFAPWTFIIYVSIYIQYMVVMLSLPRNLLRKFFFFIICLLGISLLFFIFMPIEYPRSLYPSSNSFVVFFRGIDAAGNCFPSFHVVATVFLAACYSFFERAPGHKILMWLWAFAIILSVLTTKQHYLVDIFGGLALSIPGALLFGRSTRKARKAIYAKNS